jgi:hypothetical protein
MTSLPAPTDGVSREQALSEEERCADMPFRRRRQGGGHKPAIALASSPSRNCSRPGPA